MYGESSNVYIEMIGYRFSNCSNTALSDQRRDQVRAHILLTEYLPPCSLHLIGLF